MNIITTLAFAAMLFASCSKNSISGSGSVRTENRTVTSFTAVRLEGSAKVNIVHAAEQKVEVTGYENLLPIYETNVQNGTIVLKFRNDYYNIRNNNIAVNITVPTLSKIAINGSGEYMVKNFNGESFTGEINGSGDIYAESCAYNSAKYKVNGSGYIRAAQVQSKEADAEINGSGKIDVNCNQSLKATIHGSGDINYWGNPANVAASVSGSGRITKK